MRPLSFFFFVCLVILLQVATKALNLRLKGKTETYDWNKLHYLSCHSFTGETVTEYGKSRLMTEYLDRWLTKKVSFNGLSFDDSELPLTDQDIATFACGEALKNVDAIKWEVLVRNGGKLQIHDDDVKFWFAQDSSFSEAFKEKQAHHEENYACLLTGLVSSQSKQLGNDLQSIVNADDDPDTELRDETQNGSEPVAAPQHFESEEALKAIDKIEDRCASKEASW